MKRTTMLNQNQALKYFSLGVLLFIMSVTPAYAVTPVKAKPPAQPTVSSKEFKYQIGPAPSFVVRSNNVHAAETTPSRESGDALIVLYNRQISLLGNVPEEYAHIAIKPLTSSALKDVSQTIITFNPAYQKLILHSIQILRDGKVIDLTHSVKLDLLRRENSLEKNLYEGNVTAVGVLPDTRVNDVIDLKYTVVGANPIFGKRYAEIFSMTRGYQVARYRLNLITPESRPVTVQPPPGVEVKTRRENGRILYAVEKEQLKRIPLEDRTPNWYQPFQIIQISEYQDWAGVAAWANDLFKVDQALSPEIQAQIRRWKDANLPKDQLVVEVLRWVQSEIRYFGIELGVNSHLPAPPNLTLERKFGDCKDKSLLLSTLLKALGIEAEPVLASLGLRRNVENMTPSPAVFDHAIVRVLIDGKQYWLDPTMLPQYGKIDKLSATDFGGVLVLNQSSQPLQSATYPPNFENLLQKTDYFKVVSLAQPVLLTSQIKVDFNWAEGVRAAFAKQNKSEFNKNFQGEVLRYYPQAIALGDVEYADDQVNNQVTITSKFSIEDFFKYEPGRLTGLFYATELLATAASPSVLQRIAPYALPERSRLLETIEFEFPEQSAFKPGKSNDTKAGEFWTLSSSSELQKTKYMRTWGLRSNKEAVPTHKINDYTTETRNIREQATISFKLPVGTPSDSDRQTIDRYLQRLKQNYGDSNSDRVRLEIRESIDLILATRDITSGKLSGKHLAEAYRIRAVAYDNQGYVQSALDDIRAAIKLNPDNVDYLISEATMLMGDRQFSAATQLFELAIKRGKDAGINLTTAFKSYAKSLHYLGQNKAAREMLSEAIRQESGEGLMYAAIWRYLASEGEEATATSAALQSAMGRLQDRAWPYAVGEMLLGKISPEQLISAANSRDKGVQEDQLCEAYFYIGKKYLAEHKSERAKEAFRKSVEQGVLPFLEYGFSLHELGHKKMPRKEGFWSRF